MYSVLLHWISCMWLAPVLYIRAVLVGLSNSKDQHSLSGWQFYHHQYSLISLWQQSCLHQHPGNNIWIKVPGGPSVLQVAAPLQGHQSAHSDRRASVSHSPS